MKSLKKINFLLLCIFIISSCAYQSPINRINYGSLSKDELIKKIYEVNKEYCNYERKARFKVIDDYLSEEFKGFIKNSCNDKFSMNVLGPFNKRLLAIRVENGKIYVDGRDNLDKSIKVLLDGKDVSKLVRIFKFPYMFPDNNFVFHKMAGFYLLSLNNTRIYVNSQLFIYMVEDEDSYIKYEFRGNAVSQIFYKDKDTYLKIEFI